MPAIGVLTLEVHVEDSHSLKDKRHVVKGLKDRLRARFNVSVAEIGHQDSWQHSTVSVVTVSAARPYAEALLQNVERAAEDILGGMLVATTVEWID